MIFINKTKEYVEEISVICGALIALLLLTARDCLQLVYYMIAKFIRLSLPGNVEYNQ